MRVLNNVEIEDLLITALEGGSNYWYAFDNLNIPYQSDNMAASEIIFRSLGSGATYLIYDVNEDQDEEPLGSLDMENIAKANEIMIEYYPKDYQNILDESWDAETSDIWFQLVVMGEVMFC